MSQQNEQDKKRPGRRSAVSIDEQIAETLKKLQALQDTKKRQDREKVEKNRKAISDLFKSERLDLVDVEEFRKVLPQIRALVGADAMSESEPAAAAGVRNSERDAEPAAA